MMHLFDILLIGVLAWIAIGSTSETKLFKSIVMFVVFGLFMSLAWIRLGSPDVALAEAAIGSGVTGVLLLDAAGHLRRRPTPYPEELAPGTEERTPMRSRIKLMPLLASLAALVIIATTVIALPPTAPGLSVEMSTNAETIHIKNVVTAVLLDFRGYDTLLEISVLMLATVAVLSLRVPPGEGRGRLAGESGLLLGSLAQLVAPFMIVIAGFLVWVGSSGPGGAFQAGAVLGAGGILLALAGYDKPAWARESVIRFALTIGLLGFIAIALLPILGGDALLEYPDSQRKTLLLLLEGLLTLSIGASLVSLFLASASRGRDGG